VYIELYERMKCLEKARDRLTYPDVHALSKKQERIGSIKCPCEIRRSEVGTAEGIRIIKREWFSCLKLHVKFFALVKRWRGDAESLLYCEHIQDSCTRMGFESVLRREREAIYRNSKETCGMDSTVIYSKHSKGSLLDP
jgi:hypothetical protein